MGEVLRQDPEMVLRFQMDTGTVALEFFESFVRIKGESNGLVVHAAEIVCGRKLDLSPAERRSIGERPEAPYLYEGMALLRRVDDDWWLAIDRMRYAIDVPLERLTEDVREGVRRCVEMVGAEALRRPLGI